MSKRFLLAAMAGVALIAAGCGGDDDSEDEGATTQRPAAESKTPSKPKMPSADTGAELTVESPQPGAVVTGRSVSFRVGLSNFDVDCDLAGKANKPDVGHYHLMLDGALVDMFCRDRGKISMQNVKPGKHELMFVPAVNNHMGDMKAAKKVSFTHKPKTEATPIADEEPAGKPSIEIVSPKRARR